MADRTYLFIDGEYLRRIHREAMQSFFAADGDLELSGVMWKAQASRAYFYDSLDDIPRPGEDELACRARIAPLEEFFAGVRDLSGFHVRLGTVTGQGKRRRQKEVDILLAVDMLTHGFNGSMEKAILLAGDLDFRPIIETLVRNGVFVEIWYHHTSVAQDLPGAADFGHPIRFRQLYDWNTQTFKDAHHVPRHHEQGGDHAGGTPLKLGTVAGCKAELYQWQSPLFHLWIYADRFRSIVIADENLELLERYVAAQYAPIQWEFRGDEVRIANAGAS
ncbi:MAG TPA: NYN domain-containing protein [Candidatus Acidoferrales bacterium]